MLFENKSHKQFWKYSWIIVQRFCFGMHGAADVMFVFTWRLWAVVPSSSQSQSVHVKHVTGQVANHGADLRKKKSSYEYINSYSFINLKLMVYLHCQIRILILIPIQFANQMATL